MPNQLVQTVKKKFLKRVVCVWNIGNDSAGRSLSVMLLLLWAYVFWHAVGDCSLTLGEVLGEGAFGIVKKAEASGLGGVSGNSVVAVKMLKGDCRQFDS